MPLKNGRTTAVIQQTLVGSVIPPGTIAPFGGGSVPQGWLICDGTTISRNTYSALFSAVGTVHGQGDGSTTFHLPDYRGRFLRGADNMGTVAAGRDPGGRIAANTGGATGVTVGSVQDSDNKTHNHRVRGSGSTQALSQSRGFVGGSTDEGIYRNSGLGQPFVESTGNTSESRPQNANVNYIINV